MRIIGGTHRGRRLVSPPGRGTRPMLERVREATCSVLAPWWSGAAVWDLFAGTGSFGLEALSRGAAQVRFVERDPHVVSFLRDNLRALDEEPRAVVHPGDALAPAAWDGPAPDVIFLDPPYPLVRDPEGRKQLVEALERLLDRLAPEGIVVLHVPRRCLGASDFEGASFASREYGTSAILYLQRAEEPSP